jgi:hypothetical protein
MNLQCHVELQHRWTVCHSFQGNFYSNFPVYEKEMHVTFNPLMIRQLCH